MSGHSKWAGIKHKKAIIDAKKGKAFTQVANMISVAARQGGKDPKMNPALALAIQKAKAVNMPSANVDRAIKRGTGEGGTARIEEILYEGYGPMGVAVMVEAATDNKNRTAGEVRAAFTKAGGSLGATGSVAYLFNKRGQLEINLGVQKISKEEIEIAILDSDADDFEEQDDHILVYTKPTELLRAKGVLEEAGVVTEGGEIGYVAQTEVKVADKDKVKSLLKMLDTLEELDDVVSVHANFDIPESLINELT